MKIGRKILLFVFFVLLVLGVSTNVFAQVTTELSPDEGGANETFELSITVDASQVKSFDAPRIPSSAEFDVQFGGRESAVRLFNSQMSHLVTYRFRIRAKRSTLAPGAYQLPNGSIRVDGQDIPILGRRITITTATARKADGITLEQNVDNREPYVGQQILYTSKLTAALQISQPQLSDLDATGVWKESFGRNTTKIRAIGNGTVRVIEEKQALYPANPGQTVIPARSADVQVAVRSRNLARQLPDPFGFGGGGVFDLEELFGGNPFFDTQQVTVQSDALTLQVRPLPPAPADAQRYIPVGQLSLASSLSATTATQGEPMTLTIEISGDANLRPLELEGVRFPGFRIYPDKPTLDVLPQAERILHKKRFTISLIPLQAGSLRLAPVKITYFNPISEKYESLMTPEREIEVAANPQFTPPTEPSSLTPSVKTQSSSVASLPATTIAEPNVLLREPPVRLGIVVAIISLLLPLFVWLIKHLQSTSFIRRRSVQRELETLRRQLAEMNPNASDAVVSLRAMTNAWMKLKYGLDAETMTAEELLSELAERGANPSQISTVRELTDVLESIRYSPVQELKAREIRLARAKELLNTLLSLSL